VLRTIIHRYAEEIVGTFSIPTFLFARKFLTLFFNRLLNTAAGRNMKRIFGSRYKVYERLLTRGEIEKLRSLMTKGTVIVVPTHSSNLDSILIGYAMDTILGMPSFSYGAGLNLYNTGYTAYFMNRLGAYRVDRRKKNPVYLETLKTMSNLSIQRNTNTIFFPGGTRSRSGALEDKLKMGLLGTALEAQRENYQKGTDEKIFIVPLIISYHVVLEAKYLIEQHLRQIGKERYLKARDEFYSLRKLLKFGWNFFSQPSEITLSVGKPLDVSDGMVVKDLQREMEYTKMLADRIVERYFKENIVLSSHVVAYAAFNILKNQNPRLDLFGVLRLPNDDYIFPMDLMRNIVGQLRDKLIALQKEGRIKLSKPIFNEVDKLIEDGVRNLGVYHVEKPLVFNKKGQLESEDFKLLFFYHNRLDNYGLAKSILWDKLTENQEVEVEMVEA
jgi:glycerol-3-phosphate O-acyltransferase